MPSLVYNLGSSESQKRESWAVVCAAIAAIGLFAFTIFDLSPYWRLCLFVPYGAAFGSWYQPGASVQARHRLDLRLAFLGQENLDRGDISITDIGKRNAVQAKAERMCYQILAVSLVFTLLTVFLLPNLDTVTKALKAAEKFDRL